MAPSRTHLISRRRALAGAARLVVFAVGAQGIAACGRPAATPTAGTLPTVPPTAIPPSPTPFSRDMVLATTTSTQDSGLLDVLVPLFQQQTGFQVKTVSVGTGAALELGARGEADVVLVHAPDAEKQWMAQGYGTERLLVMHNDFIVIGPPADPAAIKGDGSVLDALQKVAQKKATWISRDDNSGTDQLEKQLWKDASVSPKGEAWYVTSGQGMGATLTLADQKDAYTIADRATYLSRKSSIQSIVLVERDPKLLNVYHVMPVNQEKFPQVKLNVAGGKAFANFMVAPATQNVIATFGKDKYGEQLFFPDAGKPDFP